jgi:hypothetical protein
MGRRILEFEPGIDSVHFDDYFDEYRSQINEFVYVIFPLYILAWSEMGFSAL